MAPRRVRPNARRYVRQVWGYIESQLQKGQEVERLFSEAGIAVVWQDETAEELRARTRR